MAKLKLKTKTMKPNKLEVVKKQLNPAWGLVEIPEKLVINGPKDETCFYVVIIDRVNNSSSETYETIVRTVKYREEGFYAMQESFKRAGLKNMFILHDPTIEPEEEEKKGTAALNIAEGIELLKTAKNGTELDFMVANDTRKGIKEAASKKIEELKG